MRPAAQWTYRRPTGQRAASVVSATVSTSTKLMSRRSPSGRSSRSVSFRLEKTMVSSPARALELMGEAARPAVGEMRAALDAGPAKTDPLGLFVRFSLEAALRKLAELIERD
jgi:hypothetical protein